VNAINEAEFIGLASHGQSPTQTHRSDWADRPRASLGKILCKPSLAITAKPAQYIANEFVTPHTPLAYPFKSTLLSSLQIQRSALVCTVTFSKQAGHVLHVDLVVFHNPPTFHVPCLSGPAPASGVEGHLVLALLISARGICWGKLFIFSSDGKLTQKLLIFLPILYKKAQTFLISVIYFFILTYTMILGNY
jgi:hypothetical protein